VRRTNDDDDDDDDDEDDDAACGALTGRHTRQDLNAAEEGLCSRPRPPGKSYIGPETGIERVHLLIAPVHSTSGPRLVSKEFTS
jgi:hypothetical protein